jgi:aldehyde:ferredoxin oxidoreductase
MEYESAFALGSLVGVANPNTVIRASTLCDELGMDTISAGGTIAWAMECFEKGLLTVHETGGCAYSSATRRRCSRVSP